MSGLCIKTLFYLFIYFTVDSNFTENSLETCVNAQSDGVGTRGGGRVGSGEPVTKTALFPRLGRRRGRGRALKTTALSN